MIRNKSVTWDRLVETVGPKLLRNPRLVQNPRHVKRTRRERSSRHSAFVFTVIPIDGKVVMFNDVKGHCVFFSKEPLLEN